MSEKEKMLGGHLYQAYHGELYKDREFCKALLHEYNMLSPIDKEDRDLLLKRLLNVKGELCIEQPFYCSYGYNITIGLNFYSDVNLTILDQGTVTIGDNVILGPNVNIYTAAHPYNEIQRIKGCKPDQIYDNVGLMSIFILPGVKSVSGANIIGAGNVSGMIFHLVQQGIHVRILR